MCSTIQAANKSAAPLLFAYGINRFSHEVPQFYPNSTVAVTNPDTSVFTHMMAVENQGFSMANKCTVTENGAQIPLTDFSLDMMIMLFLSYLSDCDNGLFVGQTKLSAGNECSDISDSRVERTVSNLFGATLEVTTQDSVMPSFRTLSAIMSGSVTGGIVTFGTVGEELYLTIDKPDDYNGRPTCTTYSGTSNSGSPSQKLTNDGCSSDADLVGNYDNEVTPVTLMKRLWTTLYAL